MAINIKEIFVTDLDAGDDNWWSQHKIDKINYNFRLLSKGGAPGPMGRKGAPGDHGIKGEIGAQGFQGYRGPKGIGGENGITYWRSDLNSINYKNITPIFDSIYGLSTGLKIGFKSTDDEYSTPIDYISGEGRNIRGGINIQKYALSLPERHIDLLGDENYIGSINYSEDASVGFLKVGTLDTNEIDLEFKASSYTFTSNYSKIIELNSSNLNINTESQISGNSIISDTASLYFTPNATQGSILAKNADGTVEWKNKLSVFRVFPIGSIIKIPAFQFNEDNFNLTTPITEETGILQNVYGRGKEGTAFEGWYLCHGLTWYFGATQWEVPDLNSFEWNIDANAGEQTQESGGQTNQIILGGADIDMSATYSSPSYNIGLTNNSTNQTIVTPTGTSYDLTRMVHIVYLQNPNLVWSTQTIQADEDLINLSYGITSSTSCSSTTDNDYILSPWDISLNEWSTEDMTGVTLWNTVGGQKDSIAETGWYKSGNISRQWVKTGTNTGYFSAIFNCPITVNLSYDSLITVLNGNVASLTNDGIYTISNSSTFSTTTTLKTSEGINATAGWYRDIDTGVRRYWNGSIFKGETFTKDYVELSNISVAYSESSNNLACSSNTVYRTFLESNSSINVTTIYDVYTVGSILYVNEILTDTTSDGSKPLYAVKTINNNLNQVVIESVRGNITSLSKLDNPATYSTCT